MIIVKQVADSLVVMIDGMEDINAFAAMVQRATNLWPDAPPAIKEFADQITNPELLKKLARDSLQDYKSQNKDQRTCKHHWSINRENATETCNVCNKSRAWFHGDKDD